MRTHVMQWRGAAATRLACPVRRRRERGQSLIVSVIVMFVLLFIGGVFVGLVARNLLNTGRARDTVSADEFANAGLQFASLNLENSPEGADWRPAPETSIHPNDPDRLWLEQGFTRVDLGQGRALVRVSLSPNPRDPLGKYIKIESIGRVGKINRDDPTSFLSSPAPRLRREKVAYKAIGLTDYLRFITNRFGEDKAEAFLGVPPIGIPLTMQLGGLPVRAPGASTPFVGDRALGAPIRANCDLRLPGSLILGMNPDYNEVAYVSGKVIVEDKNKRPLFLNVKTGATGPIFGTDETFTTFGGLFRDGSAFPDANGYARSIPRLNPPLIDAAPEGGVTRYRQNTRDSGLWITRADGSVFNTGRLGLGAGVYVDNFENTEEESTSVSGGQSLRSLWLNPRSDTPYWNGPYFIPPGVFLDFGYPLAQDRDANGELIPNQFSAHPGFRAIREDRRGWTDPGGNVKPFSVQTFTFLIYKPARQRPVLKLENELYRAFLRGEFAAGQIPKPSGFSDEQAVDWYLPAFNGVIYAEGNIRVRGLLPSTANIPVRIDPTDTDGLTVEQIRSLVNPPAVTAVSNANIYIEGSLVREHPSSMIALLAREYVVVNTTMFFAPNKTIPARGENGDPRPPYTIPIEVSESSQTPPFSIDFIWGDDPTEYRDENGQPVPIQLLVRHGTPANTYLNLVINEALPPPAGSGDALYRFTDYVPDYSRAKLPPWVYPLPDLARASDEPGPELYEQLAFQLYPVLNGASYNFFTRPGSRNTIRPVAADGRFRVSNDPTDFREVTGLPPASDYLLSRVAVVPMDVRIEAVMYAQNGSFFIIPGYPFNLDPADTRDAALRAAVEAGLPVGSMLRRGLPRELRRGLLTGAYDRIPFYNEPMDCRITIVGAIAENQTASVADQAAWMQLWGYIPEVNGSTGKSLSAPDPLRIPVQHVRVAEVGVPSGDLRTPEEKTYYEDTTVDVGGGTRVALGVGGITRGLRFLYDPALAAPYPGYTPPGPGLVKYSWGAYHPGGAFRQDDYGRALPPIPRLPVCPGFVFVGEVR